MIKNTDFQEREWTVNSCFLGENALSPEVFENLKNHPLVAGESADGTRNLLFSIILSTKPKRFDLNI